MKDKGGENMEDVVVNGLKSIVKPGNERKTGVKEQFRFRGNKIKQKVYVWVDYQKEKHYEENPKKAENRPTITKYNLEKAKETQISPTLSQHVSSLY